MGTLVRATLEQPHLRGWLCPILVSSIPWASVNIPGLSVSSSRTDLPLSKCHFLWGMKGNSHQCLIIIVCQALVRVFHIYYNP